MRAVREASAAVFAPSIGFAGGCPFLSTMDGWVLRPHAGGQGLPPMR